MIKVHRLNKTEIILNANLIESIEANPDTVITLTNEKKYILRESVEEVISLVINYQRDVFQFPLQLSAKGEK